MLPVAVLLETSSKSCFPIFGLRSAAMARPSKPRQARSQKQATNTSAVVIDDNEAVSDTAAALDVPVMSPRSIEDEKSRVDTSSTNAQYTAFGYTNPRGDSVSIMELDDMASKQRLAEFDQCQNVHIQLWKKCHFLRGQCYSLSFLCPLLGIATE